MFLLPLPPRHLSSFLPEIFELMRGLDKDCDSTIDLKEFATRFEPVFTRLNAKQDVSSGISCTNRFHP